MAEGFPVSAWMPRSCPRFLDKRGQRLFQSYVGLALERVIRNLVSGDRLRSPARPPTPSRNWQDGKDRPVIEVAFAGTVDGPTSTGVRTEHRRAPLT